MKYVVGVTLGIGLLAGLVLILSSNEVQRSAIEADIPLSVVTSFYPLEFALERILGESGTVINIGAGRDPHVFQPSTRDIATLQRADAVVLQGADFEPWGDNVQDVLVANNVPVIIATANLALHESGHGHESNEHSTEGTGSTSEHTKDEHKEEQVEESHADEVADHAEHDHGQYDPHTWLDPILFSNMVEYLATEIALLDPENSDVYMRNAAELQTELVRLHNQYENRLARCTLNEVITSHDAFGYVGDRYNFGIHTIAGLSTQDTPSAVTLANLKNEAAKGVGAILLEENSITAYGETLARETGLQTIPINPITFIIPENADYISLMEDNLDTLTVALACDE